MTFEDLAGRPINENFYTLTGTSPLNPHYVFESEGEWHIEDAETRTKRLLDSDTSRRLIPIAQIDPIINMLRVQELTGRIQFVEEMQKRDQGD